MRRLSLGIAALLSVGLTSTARASFYLYNTREEVDALHAWQRLQLSRRSRVCLLFAAHVDELRVTP